MKISEIYADFKLAGRASSGRTGVVHPLDSDEQRWFDEFIKLTVAEPYYKDQQRKNDFLRICKRMKDEFEFRLHPGEEFPEAAPPLAIQSLYVIGERAGPIKIGIAVDPHRRCRGFQTGHPNRLHLHFEIAIPDHLSARKVEHQCHVVARKYKLLGEWFDLHPDTAKLLVLEVLAGFGKAHIDA